MIISVTDGQASAGVTLTVHLGSQHPDVLFGTDGADLLLGRQGDDLVVGKDGNDVMCGDRGDDFMIGGPGGDLFAGDRGSDTASDFDPAEGDSTDGRVP